MINKPLIVLAGGFGTRLQTILNGLPKPLADINGIPFLQYLLQNWINKGFNDFIFSLHFESNKIIDFLESQKPNHINCKFRYVVEPTAMGTGGAISYLLEKVEVENSFFVTNADTWVEDGYSTLNEVDSNVIGLVEVDDVRRYGSVLVDDNDFVIKFLEKQDIIRKGFINAGVYKLSKHDFINWDGKPYSIERDFFIKLIKEKKLKAKTIITNFIDIGIPEDYFKFCKLIPE
jgi:D-glycero-alpha-D-manno-heptose 1-phosphate guanylyltransferase